MSHATSLDKKHRNPCNGGECAACRGLVMMERQLAAPLTPWCQRMTRKGWQHTSACSGRINRIKTYRTVFLSSIEMSLHNVLLMLAIFVAGEFFRKGPRQTPWHGRTPLRTRRALLPSGKSSSSSCAIPSLRYAQSLSHDQQSHLLNIRQINQSVLPPLLPVS